MTYDLIRDTYDLIVFVFLLAPSMREDKVNRVTIISISSLRISYISIL